MRKPLALIMTYAYPDEENRLKTQLAELIRMGFEVHTLGFGSECLDGVSRHYEVPKKQNVIGLARVALVHVFLPATRRFPLLRVPAKGLNGIEDQNYQLVIAHDLELLPLLVSKKFRPLSFGQSIKHVDLHELHELNPTMNGLANFFWQVIRFRIQAYHEWLLSLLRSSEIDLATVVNQSIGNWYVHNNYLKNFTEVMNVSPQREVVFEERKRESLDFVYHGRYARNRGIEKLVASSLGIRDGDRFHFMLTGKKKELAKFKSFATAKNPSIVFHEPVTMTQVSSAIAKFDAEIIYFEPITQNLRFTLPNKFFEAIQGRLAIVSGPSPEVMRFTKSYGNGVATAGWQAQQLAELLAGLNRSKIEDMRRASHLLASQLHSGSESKKLRKAWLRLLPNLGV